MEPRPQPFPGMDPYLEDPSLWRGVHTRLITMIGDTLAMQLAPAFTVAIEERVYIATPDDRGRDTAAAVSGGLAITPPVLIEPLESEEVHDRLLELRDTRTREVITTIEVLSPGKKAPGTERRRSFLRKRDAVLASRSHWLEIDLLRAGERPSEVRGQGHYYALLGRADTRARYAVWFASLRSRLPVIAVPLRPPLPDVPLDLQAMIDLVMSAGGNRRRPDPENDTGADQRHAQDPP